MSPGLDARPRRSCSHRRGRSDSGEDEHSVSKNHPLSCTASSSEDVGANGLEAALCVAEPCTERQAQDPVVQARDELRLTPRVTRAPRASRDPIATSL